MLRVVAGVNRSRWRREAAPGWRVRSLGAADDRRAAAGSLVVRFLEVYGVGEAVPGSHRNAMNHTSGGSEAPIPLRRKVPLIERQYGAFGHERIRNYTYRTDSSLMEKGAQS